MLCSIIIPLYNKADFIEAALQSVFNQRYQNFEIIVVDDGSKDDGVKRVQAINDPRVTLIQQPNGGVSSARNTGISQATGDMVCFLDADDWYQPTYLETIVTMAQRYPDFSVFATSYKLVNLGQKEQAFWRVPDELPIEIIDNLYYRWRFNILFNIDSVGIRRHFLLQFSPCFPVGEQMAEDQDLYFRMSEKTAIVYCPLQLTAYRMEVQGSLCAIQNDTLLYPAHIRLEQRAFNQHMPEKLRSDALKLVSQTRITTVRSALMAGQRFLACQRLVMAWRGVISQRWWISLVMCLVASPSMVCFWENWRKQKAASQPH
jgi:glycosyltransferase involved in cell wall biosynthesis